MPETWELISKGTPTEFVDALAAEALDHVAVHHPFLERIASGDLPNVAWSLRDYAYQYAFYSREFPNYLVGVIENLESAEHREALLENLAEERGNPESGAFEDLPHTELFEHFQRAIGIDETYRAENKPATTVEVWRDLALQKCQSEQIGVAVGAIGVGTEFIVPTVYTYLLEGIRTYTELTEQDYFFFTLHATCDQEHADDLRKITIDLAGPSSNREAIRFGVLSALNLRKAFFDIMLSRAMDAPPAASDSTGAPVGY